MDIAYLADHPQYISALADWHHTQWGHLNPGTDAAWRVRQLALHTGRPAIPTTLIALEGTTLLGSASLVKNDLTTHPHLTPFLASVYVAPAFRRQGIASALVNKAVATARELGVAELYLITPDQQRLYARLGWQIRQQVEYRGEVDTLMAIVL